MSDRQTLTGYLDALASDAPAPGGGSVAGLVSALACALGEMVGALSPDARTIPEVRTAAEGLAALRTTSVEAMTKDEAAYAGYIAATRLPKSTGEEKAARRDAMQSALVAAAEAPLALACIALDALGLLHPIAIHGNKHLLSDAEIGAMLAEVAVRAALINVRVNAALIKDTEKAKKLHETAISIEADARNRLADVEAALRSRTVAPAAPR